MLSHKNFHTMVTFTGEFDGGNLRYQANMIFERLVIKTLSQCRLMLSAIE